MIDGGSGYLCQMEPVSHFAVSPDDLPESLLVHWPDGKARTQAVTEYMYRKTIKVTHPDTEDESDEESSSSSSSSETD